MSVDAVECVLAGIRAVEPRGIVVEALRAKSLDGMMHVVAVGKAGVAMAYGAVDVLGERISSGIVVAPVRADGLPSGFESHVGGHPIPNEEGVRGALAVLQLAESLGERDTLLCLISGGASALMMLPPDGVTLAEAQEMTKLLLRAGATISELNCVRKHVDRLKGGRLARAAVPARVVTLILSDVIGDPVDVISSGPTVPDPTTVTDAIGILRARGIWERIAPAIRAHLERGDDESPKPDDPCFARVTSAVIGNNTKAAQAACGRASELGYEASLMTTSLMGEAREVGKRIAEDAIELQRTGMPKGRCLVFAGETTVTVTGTGSGGRNQELALAAAMALDGHPGITLASVGTDGIDGPTDAAGAVADGASIARAKRAGCDAERMLMDNDAYAFWRAADGLVMTGPTGTNVMDLIVVTIKDAE